MLVNDRLFSDRYVHYEHMDIIEIQAVVESLHICALNTLYN